MTPGPVTDAPTVAIFPIHAWETIYTYLSIPDLISLGKAIPQLSTSLNRAQDWGRIYAQEFGPTPNVDFAFFAKNWRKVYIMNTRGRVPEMDRSKVLNRPIETLTECLLQGTDNELFYSSNGTDTKTKSDPIKGGPGICWCGHQIWVRDRDYSLHTLTVGFDIECASQQGNKVVFYSRQMGICEADIPKSTRPSSIPESSLRLICKPTETVVQLCHSETGIIYLTDLGCIYDNHTLLLKGNFKKILYWYNGYIALTRDGALYDSRHDHYSRYKDPIEDFCTSLNVMVALGSRGYLYILDQTEGLPIKDSFDIPGKVISISTGFFKKYVYAIVSQNGAKLGKRSFRTKFKSGMRYMRDEAPFGFLGAGYFL